MMMLILMQSCPSSSIDIAQNVSAGALILEFEKADHDEGYKWQFSDLQ